MINVKKFIYIIVLFAVSGIATSDHHEKPSIKLMGIEDGKKLERASCKQAARSRPFGR